MMNVLFCKRDLAGLLIILGLILSIPSIVVFFEVRELDIQIGDNTQELTSIHELLTPEYSKTHIELRQKFIVTQAHQIINPYILLMGDSNIEGLYLPSIFNLSVLNAGIGSTGINYIKIMLEMGDFHPDIIIISTGVNDANRGQPSFSIKKWADTYDDIISKALSKGVIIYLCTIIPVEKSELPLGEKYFDPNRINEMNEAIRNMCEKKRPRLHLIDSELLFLDMYNKNESYTVDGVHLNTQSQIKLANLIKQSVINNENLFNNQESW